MTVTIPDDILKSAQLSEAELMVELAVALFQQDRLTLGQASTVAQMSQLDFQRLLGSRKIAVHYGFEQLEQDLRRVGEINPS